MSENPTGADADDALSPALESPWADDADYPHRIKDHVKVYLHLEESPTQPVVTARGTTPAGTRVVTGPVEGRTEAGVGRWAVSDVAVDGYPLDGVEGGHYCDYEGHPPGARPGWDRQHREAADVHLPTAGELLPLLAAALGRSIDGPTVDQLRAASDLLVEHARWRAEREDLSAGESAGDFPASSDWHRSDDVGCDLADRAVALLAEVTGRAGSASEPTPRSPSGVSLMRSALNASLESSLQRPRPEPMSPNEARSGAAR